MPEKDDKSTTPEDVDTDQVDDNGDPDGADKLGDPGKKALDDMKGKWHSERDRRKAAEQELATLKAASAKPADGEPVDADAIREQARSEARAEVLRDRALDKLEAKAAKTFADPEDARALLAAQVDDFVDGGKIDADAIEEALEGLLVRKPHLAAATARVTRTPAPDPSQGSRSGGPPDLDALIAEAEKNGDTRAAIVLKTRKLTQTK